LVIYEFVGWGG